MKHKRKLLESQQEEESMRFGTITEMGSEEGAGVHHEKI